MCTSWAEALRQSLNTAEGKREFVKSFPHNLLVEFIVAKAFTEFLKWKLR